MLGVRGSSGERNNQQCNGDNNSQSCAQDKEWRGEIVARPHQREESDRQGRNRERGGPHDNLRPRCTGNNIFDTTSKSVIVAA